jgi:hypothetical protein
MRTTRLAGAALALVAAALLALLALDVGRWRSTMRSDDAVLRAGARPSWRPQTLLPFGAARRVLGVDDDRALREAIVRFRVADAGRGALEPGFARRARSDAEIALAAVGERGGGAQPSQADDLLGVLAYADSTSGGRASPVERSVTAFETAIRLDRGNEAAKYNLELVLRLLQARGRRPGTGPSPGARGSGRRGAGGGTPGRGY